MQYSFDTPLPTNLYVEIGRGSVHVRAADVTTTTVQVDGSAMEDVEVTYEGDQISVVAPRKRTGFFGGSEPKVDVTVVAPTGSALVAKLGSADLVAEGSLGAVRTKTGSGDLRMEHVTGAAVVDTGSGDITLGRIDGDLRAKTGSGDVTVATTNSTAGISTGSGDVRINHTQAAAVLKAGSGDLRVDRADADLSLTSGSGDLVASLVTRGGVQARNATGDIVIGVPSGLPVWTDVSSVTGRISSNLEGAGQPADGEEHLELRATSVSGDIVLKQV